MIIIAGAVYLIAGRNDSRRSVSGNGYLRVGNTVLSQEEYQELQNDAFTFNVMGEDFDTQLLDAMVDIEALNRLGIEATNEDLARADSWLYGSAILADGSLPSEDNSWRKLTTERQARLDRLELIAAGDYKGAALFFSFSRYIVRPVAGLDSEDPNEVVLPELFGDAEAIADDKDYALSQAQSYRQMIMDDPSSIGRLVAEANADTRLNNSRHSTIFGYSEDFDWSEELIYEDVRGFIQGLTETGVSEIQMMRSIIDLNDPQDSETADILYWFVYIDADSTPAQSDIAQRFVDEQAVALDAVEFMVGT